MYKFLVAFILFTAISRSSFSQASSYTDPVQAYNKLLIEKNNGSYTPIGAFKVIGTPYFFGGQQTGDVYAKGEFAGKVLISYNTYSQNLEIITGKTKDVIIKEFGTIDSFTLELNDPGSSLAIYRFINPATLQSKEKGFLQVLLQGDKYNLYKKFVSTLGTVSSNYVQADLRQFDINSEYFYLDKATKSVTKIKPTANAVLKQFKNLKDLAAVIDNTSFSANPDAALRKVFLELNK